jgi:hypothetical protein
MIYLTIVPAFANQLHKNKKRCLLNRWSMRVIFGLSITLLFVGFLKTHAFAKNNLVEVRQVTPTDQIYLDTATDWTIGQGHFFHDIAWGDLDSDGDLDIVTINSLYTFEIHKNEKGIFQAESLLSSEEEIRDLALGDIDNDGDLDLVIGKNGPNAVYKNENGKLQPEPVIFSPDHQDTYSVVLGDMDGDGDLDLAVGNQPTWDTECGCPLDVGKNKVYLNDNGVFQTVAIWVAETGHLTTNMAWADVDLDGYLDLAVNNFDVPPTLYKNRFGTLESQPSWTPKANDGDNVNALPVYWYNVAWGDMDNDGYLDLAVATSAEDKVYRNHNGVLEETPTWISDNNGYTTNIAWGDVDRDGDLDLAVGGYDTAYRNEMIKVYFNENFMLQKEAIWKTRDESFYGNIGWADMDADSDLDLIIEDTIYRNNLDLINSAQTVTMQLDDIQRSLAWGDVDNDGDLDLAIGTDGHNRLHLNINQQISLEPVWISEDAENTVSLAWGDVDGDGDLDLAAGNTYAPSKIYFNNEGVLQSSPTILFDDDDGKGLDWADVDGDGDLDIAAAGGSARIYLNQSGQIHSTPIWQSSEDGCSCNNIRDFEDIAWGDFDGDGDPDLAAGGWRGIGLFINSNGSLQERAAWSVVEENSIGISSIIWGDVDGDGDLDLAAGSREGSRIYLNENGNLQRTPFWKSVENYYTSNLLLSDIDSDGDLDLVAGHDHPDAPSITLYVNQNGVFAKSERSLCEYPCRFLVSGLAIGDIDVNGTLDVAVSGFTEVNLLYNSYLTQPSLHNQNIAVGLDLLSDPVVTFNGQSSTQLASSNYYAMPAIREGIIPINYWLYHPKSRSVGRVRLYYSVNGGGEWQEAVPTTTTALSDLTTAPYPIRSAANRHTFYWDVNASGFYGQSDNVIVRLVAIPSLKPTPNEMAGPFQQPSATTQSYPFRVRGNTVRVASDASASVDNIVLYHIPANQLDQSRVLGTWENMGRVLPQGSYLHGRGQLKLDDRLLAIQPISQTGYYTLYHTSATPTQQGMDGLRITASGMQTLTLSSANPLLIFDLNVSLEWQEGTDTSFLNNLRRDLIESSKAFYDWTNGQVALGKVTVYQGREHWDDAHIQILASNQVRPSANRGGIVTDTTILTHTLLTEPITATRGIVRIGPNWTRYGDSDPNYVYDWQRVLAHELGHYLLFLEDTYLGLDETSGLLIPVDTCTNTAMSDPYDEAGTEFRYHDERWQTECGHTLAELPDWDLIRLAYPALHTPPPVNPGPGTMPFLFTTVEIKPPPVGSPPLANPLISLGNASSTLLNGRVYLRRPNQQLLDLGKYLGNELLVRGGQEGDELCIFAASAYACSYLSNSQPANFVTRALWTPMIAVTPTSTTTLTIFVDQTAGSQINATIYPDGAMPQTVPLTPGIPQPITLNRPAVEALVEITGTVEGQRFITGYAIGSGPGRLRSFDGPGRLRSFDGPVSSGDGGVVLYPPLALDKDTFISLQLATILPPLPIGVAPIGRPYYVRPSAEIADYAGGSITFQYLGRDVMQQYIPEENLAVYYWTGSIWRRLPTIRNTAQNIASAPLQGPGLYMLSGFQTSLNGPGWNLVGYPLPYSLPITQALSPLEGFYRMVYDYDATNPVDPWRIFSVGTPSWVNDLRELKPNRGYWIYATENISWTVPTQAIATAAYANQFLYPPAVYYGWITPTVDFTPTVGMQVRAEIEGILCGTSTVQSLDGKLAYVIKVAANDGLANPPTCGAIGKTIVFTVDNWQMAHDVAWDNTRMTLHSFTQVTEIPTLTPINTPTFIPTPSSTPVPSETATVTPVVTPTPVLEESSIVGQDKVQVYLPLVSR